jgi:hypothetical protein
MHVLKDTRMSCWPVLYQHSHSTATLTSAHPLSFEFDDKVDSHEMRIRETSRRRCLEVWAR